MKKSTIGDDLIQAMGEAVEYMRGQDEGSMTYEIKVPDKIDVVKIRRKTGLSRLGFAKKFGFRPKTLQHWEQGDRRPSGPARILLAILAKDPEIVNRCLGNANKPKRSGNSEQKIASR